jgi:hypothetical protein
VHQGRVPRTDHAMRLMSLPSLLQPWTLTLAVLQWAFAGG